MKPIGYPFDQYKSIHHIDPFFQDLNFLNDPKYLKTTSAGAHTSFNAKNLPISTLWKMLKG